MRPPAAAHLTLGSAVHSAVEYYLLHNGTWETGPPSPPQARAYHRRVHQIAESGKRYLDELLPRMGSGMEVEKLYKIPPKSGLGPLPTYCITDVVDHDARRVLDHKTTSNLYSPYRLTPRKLAVDEQMLWYGYLEFREDPGDFEVRHIYYSTGSVGSDASPWVTVNWRDAVENAEMFVETSKLMFDLWAQVDKVEDVPYNLDACGDYKGCPHRSYCPHYAGAGASTAAPAQKGDGMSFFTDMLNKTKGGAPPELPTQTTPDPPAATGQVLPPDTPGARNITTAMLDEVGDAVFDALPPTAGPSEVRNWFENTAEGRGKLLAVGFGHNEDHISQILKHLGLPEDSKPASTPAASENPRYTEIRNAISVLGGRASLDDDRVKDALRELSGKRRLGKNVRAEVLTELTQEGVADSDTTHIWLVTGDAPTSPPTAETIAAAPVSAPAPAETSVPAPSPAPTAAPTPAPTASATWATTAFMVGCLPVTPLPVLTVDAAFAQYFEEVAREESVSSYLLIKYNDGPKRVAARIQADVRNGKLRPTPGFVVVPRNHPLAPYITAIFPHSPVWQAAG